MSKVVDSNLKPPSRVSRLALASFALAVISWLFGLQALNAFKLIRIDVVDFWTEQSFHMGKNVVYLASAFGLLAFSLSLFALHNIAKRHLKGRLIAEAGLVLGTLGAIIWLSVLMPSYVELDWALLASVAVSVVLIITAMLRLKGRWITRLILLVGSIAVLVFLMSFWLGAP